jgi:spore germination cell wall hydrolase CwlJ-like protein
MTETTSKSEADQSKLMSFTFKSISNVIGFIVVSIIFVMVTQNKLTELRTELNYQQAGLADASTAERTRQLDCLALNIYREAGHEPFEGKVGVAQVTLNRVAHPQFPKDVCGVVYEKNVFYERVVCQFSWYCDRVHRNRPINQAAYAESMEVAKKVLLEGFRLPSLEQALFYHADYVSPGWRHERITQIGAHIFYKKRERST